MNLPLALIIGEGPCPKLGDDLIEDAICYLPFGHQR
jgi:hypothetical protein